VVLAGSVAADPVQRRMPSGDEVTELWRSVPEVCKLRPRSAHNTWREFAKRFSKE
jgi:hypothetical protein